MGSSSPRFGVNIKKTIWNHHPDLFQNKEYSQPLYETSISVLGSSDFLRYTIKVTPAKRLTGEAKLKNNSHPEMKNENLDIQIPTEKVFETYF